MAGIPITELLSKSRIDKMVERTKFGGGEIVELLKTGSAYVAPAASIVEMVEAILLDRKKILPCAAYLDGEYGIKGIFTGVPVKLGRKGIEQIIEVKFKDDEKDAFIKSVNMIKSGVEELKEILK